MEITALKTFKALVDEGGIKGASEKLHTVPSNITSRIKKLEDELESDLFSMDGRRLKLTPNGHILYDYATKILQLEHQAKSEIQKNKGSYELQIGLPETFAAVHMPLALKALQTSNPEIKPVIYTDTSDNLASVVLENKIDCAVIGNAPDHEKMVKIPIVQEELVIVTAHDGVFEPVLFVREEGCGYRKHAMSWIKEKGRARDKVMVLSSADGVLGCVAAGLGYTIMGKNVVVGSRYEAQLKIEPAGLIPERVQLSLVYLKDCPLESGVLKLAEQFS